MNVHKVFALAGLLAVTGTVEAQTVSYPSVTPLQLPANLVGMYQASCLPSGFNADDTVNGVCKWLQYSVCSGRVCQPTVYTHNYISTWDLNGNATSSIACDIVRTHAPQVPQYTYLNGYTSCPTAVADPVKSVTFVPFGPYSWDYTTYYFVAISDDGQYTLVDSAIVYPATPQVPQN